MNENHFNELRRIARERRDHEIAAIQSDYEDHLRTIAGLEQALCGKAREASRARSINSCIESVIPPSRNFTTADIMAELQALDPARAWRKRSVDAHISVLRRRGLLKRISKANGAERAVYVRADVGPDQESRPIRAYIGEALVKPRTLTEIAVAVVEAGFQTRMTRQALRNYIGRELSEGGFKRDGERWSKG